MDEWYKVLKSDASTDQDPVLLYSLATSVGELRIITPLRSFKIALVCEPKMFWVALDDAMSQQSFQEASGAVVAAANHRSGVTKWDRSQQPSSDYLGDWTTRVSQHFIFNYIDLWIQRNPHSSFRDMVDYFAHDRTLLVDRENIGDFLEEMIVSGQVKRLPGDWMTPAEFHDILRLATEYGVEVPGNRYGR